MTSYATQIKAFFFSAAYRTNGLGSFYKKGSAAKFLIWKPDSFRECNEIPGVLICVKTQMILMPLKVFLTHTDRHDPKEEL